MGGEGGEGEDAEDDDELLPSASGAAAAALLRDVRRLAEESMRICRPELQGALRGGSAGSGGSSGSGGVPLDALLRLLRLLQRLVAGGAGRLLEPGDTVGGWGGRGCWPLMGAGAAVECLVGCQPVARLPARFRPPVLTSTLCPPCTGPHACPACRRAARVLRRCSLPWRQPPRRCTS